jgi:hypothetical protein
MNDVIELRYRLLLILNNLQVAQRINNGVFVNVN